MDEKRAPTNRYDEAGCYEIRVAGHLDTAWSAWLDGFSVTPEAAGGTLLRGRVADQAALYGLLRKMRDAGMLLLSVQRVESGCAGSAEPTEQ